MKRLKQMICRHAEILRAMLSDGSMGFRCPACHKEWNLNEMEMIRRAA